MLCKQGVAGSIPATSTNHLPAISITSLVGPLRDFRDLGPFGSYQKLLHFFNRFPRSGLAAVSSYCFESLRVSESRAKNRKENHKGNCVQIGFPSDSRILNDDGLDSIFKTETDGKLKYLCSCFPPTGERKISGQGAWHYEAACIEMAYLPATGLSGISI